MYRRVRPWYGHGYGHGYLGVHGRVTPKVTLGAAQYSLHVLYLWEAQNSGHWNL
jgi:hypothetical protein